MGKKLTQEEFENRVHDLFGDLYTVVSEYQGKRKPVTIHCNLHNVDFTVTAECFMRGSGDVRSSCPECSKDRLHGQQVKLECAFCGKIFYRAPSKVDTKSGLHFCCREHKDLAQKVSSGEKFDVMRPDHFGTTTANYRQNAFSTYAHKCAVCGWNEDDRVLQVHHIDGNHNNNQITNLVILCPTCHAKITLGLYDLIDNQLVLKNR